MECFTCAYLRRSIAANIIRARSLRSIVIIQKEVNDDNDADCIPPSSSPVTYVNRYDPLAVPECPRCEVFVKEFDRLSREVDRLKSLID